MWNNTKFYQKKTLVFLTNEISQKLQAYFSHPWLRAPARFPHSYIQCGVAQGLPLGHSGNTSIAPVISNTGAVLQSVSVAYLVSIESHSCPHLFHQVPLHFLFILVRISQVNEFQLQNECQSIEGIDRSHVSF